MRTPQDFIEDMISDCKSFEEVLVVAQSTRWRNYIPEIKDEYQKLMQRFKTEGCDN